MVRSKPAARHFKPRDAATGPCSGLVLERYPEPQAHRAAAVHALLREGRECSSEIRIRVRASFSRIKRCQRIRYGIRAVRNRIVWINVDREVAEPGEGAASAAEI